ncbi:VOC family protein [Streptomyces sp. NPDC001941]|uniref:VOC family protein n=1 Tax=Streptomyces sp. NPDC001941 TaxID=3154659 RepID=UPI003330E462
MSHPQMIFVNLPVKDLSTSRTFWEALGYSFNPQFSDDNTACLVISDTIFAMLMTEGRFRDFTQPGKDVVDPAKATEVLICLSAGSRERVDELCDAALANGGAPAKDPQDYGMMYGRSFQDPEGHHWEVMWMDPSQVQG